MSTCSPAWPFVGRGAAMDQIRRDLDDRSLDAVVVSAPAGTGKTRLAREVARAAPTAPLWLQASPAAASVPLGALADVVDVEDSNAAFRQVEAAAARAGGLVIVDDAPHLDPQTADLLHRLVSAGATTVLATARSGEPVGRWLEWLWLGERTRHHELDPIDEASIETLVATVLADVERSRQLDLARTLEARTGGNALFLRELLTALARRHRDGLELEVEAPPHLMRVLQARLEDAGPGVSRSLQTAAILGAVALSAARRACSDEAIDAAEQDGWLIVEDGPRAMARPAHPLYAEAALAALSVAERRRLTRTVATAVLDDHGSTGSERLHATTALVDVGSPVRVADLVSAAQSAFSALDHDLAARLAIAAIADGGGFEAQLVLGAAHSGAGRSLEAEEALRAALRTAADDDERARGAGRLSVHLVAHGGRIDEAGALLDQIEPLLVDPAARAFVAADRAKLASIRGDLTAIEVPDASADEPTRLNAAIVAAYAQAMAGDAPACWQTIDAALPLAERHRALLPWSGELVRFSGTFAALGADGPIAAQTWATEHLGRPGPAAEATAGTWRFLVGFAGAVGGAPAAAAAALDRAVHELDGHDLISARPLAIAARGWVAAQCEELDLARSCLDAAVDAAGADGRVRVQVATADAWCDTVEAGVLTSAATAKLVAGAAEAIDGAQVLSGVIVLHELVRLGAPEAAIAPLERVRRSAPDSWLLAFVADRARAELDADIEAIARLARRAEARWPIAAAELHLARQDLATARHDDATAVRAAFEAHRVATSLGKVLPWTLRRIADPLTERERHVATTVAGGASNRSVAEAAGVSVRTVENQLQSVYRKLGVASRRDLVSLFATGDGSIS